MNPATIGRYRVIRVLGQGGMGTVYEAEQDQPHRMVALKVMHPGLVSPELSRRFARESEVLGRLQHPGIAQIYEAGTAPAAEGAQAFFAMELVRGQSLTEYATSHSLTKNQRLVLFARICDAVHYAHQQGVIHRDLKPANILIDPAGQPKILDFGVARLTDSDVQVTRQTSVGEVIGTLQYMSPEQVNADPADIDNRSDVYTLGVILYELMTDRLPYDLGRMLIYEAAKVIMVDDAARLSTVDKRLAGDVEIIVAKTLEKEKARRYGSADELASDVRRFLRDEPIVARPASAIYQLRKFARRNRTLVTGLAAAAAILVAGTVVSVWQAVRATAAERLADSRRSEAVASSRLAERRRAVADSALGVADSARVTALREQAAATRSAQQAQDEAAKARAINGFLQKMLASSDPNNARGKELSVRELLDQAAAEVSSGDLARQPEVRASVESTIGRTYFGLGLLDQARPHMDSAYAIRLRTLGPAHLDVAASAHDVANVERATGDYAAAERKVTEALTLLGKSVARDDDRITEALVALADIRYMRGKLAEAEKLYRDALSLTRSRHHSLGLELAARLQSLGTFLSYVERPAEGHPLLVQAVEAIRRVYGSNHPRVVDAVIGLSDAEAMALDYRAAEKTLREVLPTARSLYGQQHPVVANVLSRLGDALREQHRAEEAEPIIREALAMRIKLLGDQHPDVQLSRTDLARMLIIVHRFAQADSLLEQALSARRATLGEDSPAVASTLTDLGFLAKAQEDWPAAEQWMRKALPIWRAAKIEEQELFAQAELGWALWNQRKLDQAEPMLRDALARRRALGGDEHWAVGDLYDKLMPIALARGQTAQAESLGTAALANRRKVYGPKSIPTAGQLLSIAFLRESLADTAGAVPLLRESLEIANGIRPPSDPTVISAQRFLAIDLCATGGAAEGERIIRSAIKEVPADSTQPLPSRLQATLGFCLALGGHFAEAEPILLAAEAGLATLPPNLGAKPRAATVNWLVGLYRQWGKADKETEWRERLKP